MTRTTDNLEAFTLGYAEAMLWANTIGTDATGEPDDSADVGPYLWQTPSSAWQLEAFDSDSRASIETDCVDFFRANLRDLIGYAHDGSWSDRDGWRFGAWQAERAAFACAGHDFALTRNGHGTGFWDRGMGELGDRLTSAAHVYGSSSALVDMSDDATDTDAHLMSL